MNEPAAIVIRPETAADQSAVRMVNIAAFPTAAEAKLVDALRAGGHVVASLVAEDDQGLVGHILLTRLTIVGDDATTPAVALAPMAVAPLRQRQGIGSRLVEAGLAACQELGERIVVVLGHPEFYPRFGFSAELAKPLLALFSGPAWMALELTHGALDGVAGRAVYPPPFEIDCDS